MKIAVISQTDFPQLIQLRKSAYLRGYGGNVNAALLGRGPWDYLHLNFGIYEGSQILSAVRIAFITSPADFRFILDSAFDHSRWRFPAGIMHRAATSEEMEGRGLHSLLRCHLIRLAHQLKVHWLFSGIEEDSGRLPQLREAGYEITIGERRSNQFLKRQSASVIAALNVAENGLRAERRLQKGKEELFNSVEVDYSVADIRRKYQSVFAANELSL